MDSLKQNLILLKLLGPTKISELAQKKSNPQFGRQHLVLNSRLVSSSKAGNKFIPSLKPVHNSRDDFWVYISTDLSCISSDASALPAASLSAWLCNTHIKHCPNTFWHKGTHQLKRRGCVLLSQRVFSSPDLMQCKVSNLHF